MLTCQDPKFLLILKYCNRQEFYDNQRSIPMDGDLMHIFSTKNAASFQLVEFFFSGQLLKLASKSLSNRLINGLELSTRH